MGGGQDIYLWMRAGAVMPIAGYDNASGNSLRGIVVGNASRHRRTRLARADNNQPSAWRSGQILWQDFIRVGSGNGRIKQVG